MDCFRWARKEVGTAPFPKAQEYQKLKVGAYNQEEESKSEIDLYTTADVLDEDEEDESQREDDSLLDEREADSEDSELEEDFNEKQG